MLINDADLQPLNSNLLTSEVELAELQYNFESTRSAI